MGGLIKKGPAERVKKLFRHGARKDVKSVNERVMQIRKRADAEEIDPVDSVDIWTHASFLPQRKNTEGYKQAGGAALICDFEGAVRGVLIHDLNPMNITQSISAEFWSASLTLKYLKQGSVRALNTDNFHLFKHLLEPLAHTIKKSEERDGFNERQIMECARRGFGMKIRHVVPIENHLMPLADEFAGAIARHNFASIRRAGERLFGEDVRCDHLDEWTILITARPAREMALEA